MAYVLQSAETFQFLHVSPRNGDVGFSPSLLTALRHGLVDSAEEVAQLVADWFDPGECIVVDIRLFVVGGDGQRVFRAESGAES